MKSIVTGGCGFIGSHLVDRLLEMGHEVTVLDNMSTGRTANLKHVADRVKILTVDLADAGQWMEEFRGCDWVFHLAGRADIVPSVEDPRTYFRANVDGTFNVLEAARAYGIKRFIYTASSTCYGIAEKVPTSEDAPIQPEFPYALTKRMGEEQVLHWSKLYKLPAISLRFFNVYGPRSRTSGTYGALFGVLLAQKLAGKPYTVVGDGNQTRDFTYVSDIVDAIVTAAKSNRTATVYNVGSGQTVSVNRIVELLGGEKVFIPKRPGEPDCTFADISKIEKELNWKPKVTIEMGVQELLKQIDYWKEAPVWEPDSIAKATAAWFKYLGK